MTRSVPLYVSAGIGLGLTLNLAIFYLMWRNFT